MLFEQGMITFAVAWNSQEWLPNCIKSYRQLFPLDRIVIVDNNYPQNKESAWLDTREDLIVVRNHAPSTHYSHGNGMDSALAWCREHRNIGIIIHIEPDMLFWGKTWKYDLLNSILVDGNWMAGSHRKTYGPIHPTVSAWDITIDWDSFCECEKIAEELTHPRYSDLVNMSDESKWFHTHWDTAQKNWFYAESNGKAGLLKESGVHGKELRHFWNGGQSKPPEEYYDILANKCLLNVETAAHKHLYQNNQ